MCVRVHVCVSAPWLLISIQSVSTALKEEVCFIHLQYAEAETCDRIFLFFFFTQVEQQREEVESEGGGAVVVVVVNGIEWVRRSFATACRWMVRTDAR